MKRKLKVRELTAKDFAPYGFVITVREKKPKLKEKIFTFWDGLAVMKAEGDIGFSLLEVVKREREFSKFERHLSTQEVFFAIDGDVIVIVGEPTPNMDRPDLGRAAAFRLIAGEGILMHKGTWHWVPYPYGDKAHLLIVFRAGTPDEDVEIKDMKEIEEVEFVIEL